MAQLRTDLEPMCRLAISALSNPSEAQYKLKVIQSLTHILPTLHTLEPEITNPLWESRLAVDFVSALVAVSVERGLVVSSLETERVRRLGGDAGLMWYPGLVLPESEGFITGLEVNQTAVLQCLIALCEQGPWRVLVASSRVAHTQALLYSLLNVMAGHRKRAGEVGLLSAKLLISLLRPYKPEEEEYATKGQMWLPEDLIAPSGNLGAAIVSSLASDSEFQVLCEGLIEDLLEGVFEPLPLLLRFSEANSRIHMYLCTHRKSINMLTKLVCELWKETDLLHCELLNCLTADRSAGLLLASSPALGSVPIGVSSLFDLLAAATHKTILKGQIQEGKILAATLRNASYFLKRINTASSHFLISTLKIAAQWSLDLPSQLDTLRYIVELIANRIDYHWTVSTRQGSIPLVYEFLRAQKTVESLFLKELPREWPLETLKVALGLEKQVAQLGANTQEQDISAVLAKSILVGLLPTPRPVSLVVLEWCS